MPKGTISGLNEHGYGFIKIENEAELFFHHSALERVEFNSLSIGQKVEFEKGQGRDGRPAAVKVRLTETQVEDDAGGGGEAQ